MGKTLKVYISKQDRYLAELWLEIKKRQLSIEANQSKKNLRKFVCLMNMKKSVNLLNLEKSLNFFITILDAIISSTLHFNFYGCRYSKSVFMHPRFWAPLP